MITIKIFDLNLGLKKSIHIIRNQFWTINLRSLFMRKSDDKAKISCSNFAMKKAFKYYDNYEYDTAIKYCSLAIKIDPQNGMAYNLRGAIYIHNYWFTWSFRDLNKALSLGFNNDMVYSNLGDAYMFSHQCDKAVNNYSIALELNPENFCAWSNRGYTFIKMRLYEKAVPDLKIALTLRPKDSIALLNLDDAYLGRGQQHLKAGRDIEAVDDFSNAMNHYDFVVEAYEGRASAYTNLGMIDLAKADMVKAKFFRDKLELNQKKGLPFFS